MRRSSPKAAVAEPAAPAPHNSARARLRRPRMLMISVRRPTPWRSDDAVIEGGRASAAHHSTTRAVHERALRSLRCRRNRAGRRGGGGARRAELFTAESTCCRSGCCRDADAGTETPVEVRTSSFGGLSPREHGRSTSHSQRPARGGLALPAMPASSLAASCSVACAVVATHPCYCCSARENRELGGLRLCSSRGVLPSASRLPRAVLVPSGPRPRRRAPFAAEAVCTLEHIFL